MIVDFSLRVIRFLYRKVGISREQEFGNKPFADVLHAEEANEMIAKVIANGKPEMISRFGTPESNCLLNYHEIQERESSNYFNRLHALFQNKRNFWDDKMKSELSDLVGFFPTDIENLKRFATFYIEQIKRIDSVGVWAFVPGETYLINKYCPNAQRYDPTALEPYLFTHPWSAELEGKKVLVVHPFAKSITKQYAKREYLFPGKNVMPDFKLKTVMAVQSIAGTQTNFKTWFDALDWMQNEIDKQDFDVALIGAGSYGIPLSAYVKAKGKISIHMGGSLQLFFGIKGKRWDDHEIISKLYNEHWVRPSADETISGAQKVEGACYW